MISVFAIAIVATAIFATLTIYRYRTKRVEGTYQFIQRWRGVLSAIALTGIVWTFIRSGEPELVFVAGLAIAFVTLYILIEQPHRTLV